MKKPHPAETVGFNIAAAVPLDRVGFVLKALYDNGCPPSSFDLKAIIGGDIINGHQVEARALPALDAPRRKPGNPGKRAETPTGKLRAALLALLAERYPGSVTRKELRAVATRLGMIGQAADTQMWHWGKEDIITRPETGHAVLTAKGLALANKPPKPPEPEPKPIPPPSDKLPPGIRDEDSGTAIALRLFQAEPLKHWTKLEMSKAFQAQGGPARAKDFIDRLVKMQLVKKVGPGSYKLA